VPKIHKIEHTVEGIFDVVSSIILNTDHSLRVLKIFLIFSSVGIVLRNLIKTLLIGIVCIPFKIGGVIFGFTVTQSLCLWVSWEKRFHIEFWADFLNRHLLNSECGCHQKSTPTISLS
jgi:hypothetical protein